MKKTSKIILVSVLAIGVTGGVFAFGSHHYFSNLSMQEKAEMISDRIDRKLDLNDVQKANLDELTLHVAGLMQQVKDNRQSREDILNGMLSDQPVDQSLILQAINDKTTMINENAPQVVARLAGFVDSLNAEQKAEIKQMIEKRKGHRYGRHEGKHGFFNRD